MGMGGSWFPSQAQSQQTLTQMRYAGPDGQSYLPDMSSSSARQMEESQRRGTLFDSGDPVWYEASSAAQEADGSFLWSGDQMPQMGRFLPAEQPAQRTQGYGYLTTPPNPHTHNLPFGQFAMPPSNRHSPSLDDFISSSSSNFHDVPQFPDFYVQPTTRTGTRGTSPESLSHIVEGTDGGFNVPY
jgi:hypothetical protein